MRNDRILKPLNKQHSAEYLPESEPPQESPLKKRPKNASVETLRERNKGGDHDISIPYTTAQAKKAKGNLLQQEQDMMEMVMGKSKKPNHDLMTIITGTK